ncbi:MAG: HlyD family type I secretion periplasmic adaptor subunit [Paracoccaceae bacterium]
MTRAVSPLPPRGVLQLEDYNRVPEPASRSGFAGYVILGLLIVTSFVGGTVYWATSSRLDGAVVAPATFVVEGNRKTVEHLDGGIVRQILVADGDLVEAGQTLLELDGTDVGVDLGVIESQLSELLVRRARLIAQISGAEQFERKNVPDALQGNLQIANWSAAFATQKLLFDAETRTRKAEKELLSQRIANLEAQIAGLQNQRNSNARQLEITQDELGNLNTLLDKGLVTAARINSRKVEVERLRGVDASLATEEAQARNQISELQLTDIGTATQRTELATAELAEVDAELATLEPRYTGALERQKRIAISAPVSGRVVGLSVFTEGGLVRPGEPILDIVPAETDLIVEARVNTADIEKLYVGQSSRVRLSGFDQGEIPEATGAIVDISADSFEDTRTGQFYYNARIMLDRDQPAQVASLELLPGMPADLFVNTGERTVLSYLAQPLKDRLARTFIE